MADVPGDKPAQELQASEGLSLSSAALATWMCLELTAETHLFGPYASAASLFTCAGVGALTYLGVRENTKVPVQKVQLDSANK